MKGLKPAKRGDSIKPGVERSGTPGFLANEGRAHEVGDSALIISELRRLRIARFARSVFIVVIN